MILKKKLLVVDGDPQSEEVLKPALTKAEYQSLFVLTAKEGLQVAREWQPHLILLDLVLPRMSGLGFLREIQHNPRTKNIPVLIMSDLGDFEVIYEAMELGAVGYVTKSNNDREVLSMVSECLPRVPGKATVPGLETTS